MPKSKIYLLLLFFLTFNKLNFIEEEDELSDDSDSAKTVPVGIDLGTTYSCASAYIDGKVVIIPNEFGRKITPSTVMIDANGRIHVGDAAKNYSGTDTTYSILYDSKRMIGQSYKATQKFHEDWPFLVENSGGKPRYAHFSANKKKTLYSPEEISAEVLKYMVKQVKNYTRQGVRDVVITVPAKFNEKQREVTKDAGTLAGLNVIRVINEPTAASLAYGLDLEKEARTVLVFDLGGGTFDVSILEINEGLFEVITSGGDAKLGGQDFDNEIMKHVLKTWDMTQDDLTKREKQNFKNEAERVKRTLSNNPSETFSIEIGGELKKIEITEVQFKQMIKKFVKRCMKIVKKTLKDGKLKVAEIHEVVLVGGSTKVPYVREELKKLFNGKEPNTGVNPDEAVAYGAAIQAAISLGVADSRLDSVLLVDIVSMSLGIEVKGGLTHFLIKKDEKIPVKKTQDFTTEHAQQDAVKINILQGESPKASRNHLLGSFTLDRISTNFPKIVVSFELDANSILKVSAKDPASGREEELELKDSLSMSDEEIEELTKKFKAHEEEDEVFLKFQTSKNELVSLIERASSQIPDEKKKKELENILTKAYSFIDPTEKNIKELNNLKAQAQAIIGMAGQGDMGAAAGSEAEEEEEEDLDEYDEEL